MYVFVFGVVFLIEFGDGFFVGLKVVPLWMGICWSIGKEFGSSLIEKLKL